MQTNAAVPQAGGHWTYAVGRQLKILEIAATTAIPPGVCGSAKKNCTKSLHRTAIVTVFFEVFFGTYTTCD
jgi:hypothetical protein